MLAGVAEAVPSELDLKIDALRARAMASLTPAQMARRLGLETRWLEDLMARHGVHVSGGASHGNTFSGRDRRTFEATREQLFDAVLAELGAPALVTRADAVSPDWWSTSGGSAAATVVGLLGIDASYTTRDRTPIPLWRSRMIWVTLAIGLFLCVVPPVGLLFLEIWRRSYFGWRDGSKASPNAAISLGILVILAPILVTIVIACVSLIERLRAPGAPIGPAPVIAGVLVAGVVIIALSFRPRARRDR